MPFPSSGAVSASDVSSYFGGGSSLSDYYLGGSYIPNLSENSGHPSSGSISYSNFYGKYAKRGQSFTWTAGGPISNYIGFSENLYNIGSLSSANSYTSGSGYGIAFEGLIHNSVSSTLILYLGNTASTPSILSWNPVSNTNSWYVETTSNIGSVVFSVPDSYGSGGGSGWQAYNFSVAQGGTLFTSGSSYTTTIYWIA